MTNASQSQTDPTYNAEVVPDGYGYRGRSDGSLEVACYCGRTTVLMDPMDVYDGVAPPPCDSLRCRRWAKGWDVE